MGLKWIGEGGLGREGGGDLLMVLIELDNSVYGMRSTTKIF